MMNDILLTKFQQYIESFQLGHTSIDRDFCTIKEGVIEGEQESDVFSAKRGKGLYMGKELQLPYIHIILDVNVNLKIHIQRTQVFNPIDELIEQYASDYTFSFMDGTDEVKVPYKEHVITYGKTVYESQYDRCLKAAHKSLQESAIPVIVTDLQNLNSDIPNEFFYIILDLPLFSPFYHSFYVEQRTSYPDFFYLWN